MSRSPDVVRMLTLIPWLLARPGATVQETAAVFGTDEATLREELGHLDFCGLPGLGGGALFEVTIIGEEVYVRMADELRRPLRPTPIETLRLLLIATVTERAVGGDVPALRSAIGKLRVALGVEHGAVDVLQAEPGLDVLEARRAISLGRCVRFDYRGRQDAAPHSRLVEPWRLDLVDGAWYLHGHDRGAADGRIFRLDRAVGLVVDAEPVAAPRPDHLPLPAYRAGEDDLEVVLDLGPGAAWLLDALTVDDTLEVDRGIRVRLHTGSPEWLARLVLMGGGAAVVVSPGPVRDLVARRAEEALERHARASEAGGVTT
jgi:proteasome accessory factor C